MTIDIVPAAEFEAQALAACFTDAFEGYLAGTIVLTGAALPGFLRRQGADLALSRCVSVDGRLAGLAFVGEFDGRRRVGGMGVRHEARGTGASRRLLERVIDDARAAGMHAVELEVFAQNTPALRLYRALGFGEIAALWGFTREPATEGREDERYAYDLAEGDAREPLALTLDDAADWLLAHGPRDLPYQASGHALRRTDPATRVWRLGQALMAALEVPDGPLIVPLLVDADPAQADARRLLAHLARRWPAHRVRVPQLMRDDVAAQAFRAAGFAALPLHQLHMRLALD
jgi:GNAT superfamily N-acetyltransferase